MAPTTLTWTRLTVRGLQSIVGLVAIIFVSLGYIEFTSGQLSSAAAIYSNIANYTAILCGLYYIVALHMLQLSRSGVKVIYARIVDLLLVVALVIAGIVHSNSAAYQDCASYNEMFETYHGSALFRCGSMKTGAILTFVNAGLFAVSLAMSFKNDIANASNARNNNAHEEEPSADLGYAAVQTPGVDKPTDDLPPVTAETYHPRLRTARLSGRGLQFVLALVAMVCTLDGYHHYYTGQYLSPKAMYAIIITYTSVLYALWHLVVVEKLALTRRPKLNVERTVDGVMALLLLVAGIIVASSTQFETCDSVNASFVTYHAAYLFRCGSMTAGLVFSFVTIVAYAVTLGVSFVRGAEEENLRYSMMTVLSTHSIPDASVLA